MLLSDTQSGDFINRSYAWLRGSPRPKSDQRIGVEALRSFERTTLEMQLCAFGLCRLLFDTWLE